MPNGKEREGPADRAATDRRAVGQLTATLGQPLTAASNYIGAARLILSSSASRQVETAVEKLDKAAEQILRAGEIVGQLRGHLGENSTGLAIPGS